ncbi:hypothetical protein ACFLR8_01400 [Bacteroidota bacterium]
MKTTLQYHPENQLPYWPKLYSRKALIFSILIIALFNIIFMRIAMPAFMIIAGITILFFFFYSLAYYTLKWQAIPLKVLYQKLFLFSLLYRLVFLAYVYLLTYLYDPTNLEMDFGAMDAWRFYGSAMALKAKLFQPEYWNTLAQYWRNPADWGFPIYLSIIHYAFGNSVFIPKLINCFLGSLTVVYLTKLAYHQHGVIYARIVGITAMLIPTLLWFSCRYLKEPLMIFLIVIIFYHSVRIVKRRQINILSILIIVFFTYFLFYFRTVLAVLVIFSIVSFFLLNSLRGGFRNIIIIISTIIFLFAIFRLAQQSAQIYEVEEQYDQSFTIGPKNVEYSIFRLKNISVKTTTVYPLIIASSFFAPFPSFLNLDERQLLIIAHYPNELVRNIIYYFALLGIFSAFRKKLKENILLLTFVIGYILILGITGNAQLERFQVPALPFIIVFISAGIVDSHVLWHKRFNLYLIIMFCIEASWNIFKMDIRGIL